MKKKKKIVSLFFFCLFFVVFSSFFFFFFFFLGGGGGACSIGASLYCNINIKICETDLTPSPAALLLRSSTFTDQRLLRLLIVVMAPGVPTQSPVTQQLWGNKRQHHHDHKISISCKVTTQPLSPCTEKKSSKFKTLLLQSYEGIILRLSKKYLHR